MQNIPQPRGGGNVTSIKPGVAYVEESDESKFNKPYDTLTIVYDVSDVSSPTKLFNAGVITSDLKEVIIDKEYVPVSSISSTHQFDSPGLHVIMFRYSKIGTIFQTLSAFEGCRDIKSMKIPEGPTSFSVSTFKNCSKLETLSIPKTTTSFGTYSFVGCTSMKKVNIKDFNAFLNIVMTDASSSFFYVSTGKIYLNGEVLTEVIIPDGKTEVKNSLFHNNIGITHVSIPNSVKTIGISTFNGCKNVTTWDVDFGNLTTIKSHAFRYCKNLPENLVLTNLTTIGIFSFGNTNIKTASLPALPRIPDGDRNTSVFGLCSNLTSITFSENLVYLGRHPFSRNANSNLVVTFPPTTPPDTNSGYPTEWFYNGRTGQAFYVPAESLEAYRTAAVWSNYASMMQPIP